MRIVDSDNGTIVEFENKLTPEELDVLKSCLSLFELELKELERKKEIDHLFMDLKKGRAERFLKSVKGELTNH